MLRSSRASASTPPPFPSTVTNKWTEVQREFLVFVKRAYIVSWPNLANIFNTAFERDLILLGFNSQHRLLETALRVQHGEMKRLQNPIFTRIHEQIDQADLLHLFPTHDEMYLRGAKECNIRILLRNADNREQKLALEERLRRIVLEPRCERARRLEYESDQLFNYQLVSEDNRSASSDATEQNGFAVQDSEQALTLEQAPHSSENHDLRSIEVTTSWRRNTGVHSDFSHDGIPFLLFRTYDIHSQGVNTCSSFLAGKFVSCGLPSLDTLMNNDDLLLIEAAKHFNREKSPSAFISTTSSFVWAVYMAMKKVTEHGEDVLISVLDGRIVASQTRILEGREIVARLKASGYATFRYTAAFEHLVYGSISETGVIGTFSVSQLLSLADECLHVKRCLRIPALIEGAGRGHSMSKIWKNLELLQSDQGMAEAVARVIMMVKSNISPTHPVIKDIIRVLRQNFCFTGLDTSEEMDLFLGRVKSIITPPRPRTIGVFSGVLVPIRSIKKENRRGPAWLYSPYSSRL